MLFVVVDCCLLFVVVAGVCCLLAVVAIRCSVFDVRCLRFVV